MKGLMSIDKLVYVFILLWKPSILMFFVGFVVGGVATLRVDSVESRMNGVAKMYDQMNLDEVIYGQKSAEETLKEMDMSINKHEI